LRCIPYEKRFGTENPFSLENQEYLGIHPEGSIRFIQNTIAETDRRKNELFQESLLFSTTGSFTRISQESNAKVDEVAK